MKRIWTLSLLLGLWPVVQAAGHRDTSSSFRVTSLTDTVSLLQGRGGNLAVSHGPDGVLLVDSDFADMSPALATAVKSLGVGPVRYLLNTHWHSDHTGGNAALKPMPAIIAHHNVRARVSTTQQRPSRGSVVEPLPVPGWPVVTFTQSNVVHLGDLFFSGRFPFIDLDTGGSVEGYIHNVGLLLNELPADVKIIPGHGPLSTLDDLRTYHRMLTSTALWSRQQRAAGLNLEQAIATGLANEWNGWGDGFIDEKSWITTLYQDLPMDAPATP